MRFSPRSGRNIVISLLVISSAYLALVGSLRLATHAATIPSTHSIRVTQNLNKWNVVSSPNPGTADNVLNGVATISAHDVWAVGQYTNSNSGYTGTLIEHWNGTSWSVIPGLNPEPESILNGVAAVTTSNVWAVGYQQITNTALTLIEHWNGTSWSAIPSPNVTAQENILTGVAVVSASDIWAVGYDNIGNVFENQTLIEHWNGTSWSIVPSLNPSPVNNVLRTLAVVNTNNMWAVGYNDSDSHGSRQALIEHWNGTKWLVIPSSSSFQSELLGITVISSKNMWAVGDFSNIGQPLTEHWNGIKWSIVSSPTLQSGSNLTGVAAISSTNMWAVGTQNTPTGTAQILVEHWNGIKWSVIPSPNIGSSGYLNEVKRVPSTSHVWAVGTYYDTAHYFQTLTECYC